MTARKKRALFELSFQVIDNKRVAEEIYHMRMRCADERLFSHFVPGQFLHIRVPNAAQLLLRRPISIHAIDAGNTVEIIYAVVGEGTKRLAELRAGDQLAATGPVGRGFALNIPNTNKIWLLSGGLGCAPLYAVMQSAPDREYRAFFGFPGRSQVFDFSAYQTYCQPQIFTDDGSLGQPGFALDGLLRALDGDERPDLILACGPTPMIRALKQKLPPAIACQVSLESRMGCGTGACLVCNCKIQRESENDWHYRRVCVDGPVFDLREVRFD